MLIYFVYGLFTLRKRTNWKYSCMYCLRLILNKLRRFYSSMGICQVERWPTLFAEQPQNDAGILRTLNWHGYIPRLEQSCHMCWIYFTMDVSVSVFAEFLFGDDFKRISQLHTPSLCCNMNDTCCFTVGLRGENGWLCCGESDMHFLSYTNDLPQASR